MSVYDACVDLSRKTGISLNQLCERAGVPSTTVDKWKRNPDRVPEMWNIERLASVLGVTPLALLRPDMEADGEHYTCSGVAITDRAEKLKIAIISCAMSVDGFAGKCGLNSQTIYRYMRGGDSISLRSVELIANVLHIPMYVLLDSQLPLRVRGYAESEVSACSAENVMYNVRTVFGLSHQTKKRFCEERGVSDKWLSVMLARDTPRVSDLKKLSECTGLSIVDLMCDYTTNDGVHDKFCQLSCVDRLKFMMTLKGVTPKYICNTFGWTASQLFSWTSKSSCPEIPYIMVAYFKCPRAWFTRDTISLVPGQTLRTPWNEII